ncbi:MAG: phospho-sugar mutase [Oscillospiraceae bacterium]|jgi:phosphoglucomutase|nr:phospho-sugar mutase [Oscillospiraceae bacterium]
MNRIYKRWLKYVTDRELERELFAMEYQKELIEDCFYKNLEFGTGGLRGIIGPGTNRMNIYTVRKATQGLANYLLSKVSEPEKEKRVAIAYDTRNKSNLFAKSAAEVLAANGIRVFISDGPLPTPMLSFAVRDLQCDAGICITASHNPAAYNGYKAYGADGCQLGLKASAEVTESIDAVDVFKNVKFTAFNPAFKEGKIRFIGRDTFERYYTCVLGQRINHGVFTPSVMSVDQQTGRAAGASWDIYRGTDRQFSDLDEREKAPGILKVVYTPLNGAGNMHVREILKRTGITDITVVPEQENPDGNFTTCPYPNPETKEALAVGLKLCNTVFPDLFLATDPDSDRIGIAVKDKEDNFEIFSGNDVGALLFEYICMERTRMGIMPDRPVAVKTVVTTDIIYPIARTYGVDVINVLTGFKFIGEQIGILESRGEQSRYIFGFEESCGYLAGTYARDKDAIVAAMLICEMAAKYRRDGKTLIDAREEMFRKYGYYVNTQKSFEFEGEAGGEKMKNIMADLRIKPPYKIAGLQVIRVSDYLAGTVRDLHTGKVSLINLPKSDVLAFTLDHNCSITIRPSGTEPKIKVYYSAAGISRKSAETLSENLRKSELFQ